MVAIHSTPCGVPLSKCYRTSQRLEAAAQQTGTSPTYARRCIDNCISMAYDLQICDKTCGRLAMMVCPSRLAEEVSCSLRLSTNHGLYDGVLDVTLKNEKPAQRHSPPSATMLGFSVCWYTCRKLRLSFHPIRDSRGMYCRHSKVGSFQETRNSVANESRPMARCSR
jgi:hypothetical protein